MTLLRRRLFSCLPMAMNCCRFASGYRHAHAVSSMFRMHHRFPPARWRSFVTSARLESNMEELFKSLERETPDPVEASIQGTIPDWLEGCLYRVGPGKFEFGKDKFNHWFDGMALVHRFEVHNGQVTYQNRFIQSDSYKQNLVANRITLNEFGTMATPDPCKTLFERFFSFFEMPRMTDNTLVNVFPMGEYLYAATETNYLRKLDRETLDTVGDKVDISEIVAIHGATAHPHFDRDGTYHNIGSQRDTTGPRYAIVKITPDRKGHHRMEESAKVVASIPARWKLHPGYFHSFAMTENYYVLVEMPLVISVPKLFTAKLRGQAFCDSMEWYGDHPCRFHIINKFTGEKLHPNIEIIDYGFVVLHHANAYEEDGHIVIDACFHEGGAVYDQLPLERLQSPGVEEEFAKMSNAQLRRYVLPTTDLTRAAQGESLVSLAGTTATAVLKGSQMHCRPEELIQEVLEFPQINYNAVNGRKYRYVYGCGAMQGESMGVYNGLLKVDVETREVRRWREEGHVPSEPVFVQRPHPQSEDDGVVLSLVLTTGPDRYAYMLVLDALSWQEIARANVNRKLPKDIHGTFVSSRKAGHL